MASEELKWWHVRWRLAGRAVSPFAVACGKVLGLLCLVAALGYGVIYLISPWLVSERMCKLDPRLCIVPVSLPTRAEASLSKTTIDHSGFRVRLPNEEVIKTMQGDTVTWISFRKDGNLIIDDPSRDLGMLEIAMSDKRTETLVRKEARQSKFKLMQAAMLATPEQVKWWKFRSSDNERVVYLLLLKFSLLSHLTSAHAFSLGPIYTISAGEFRGFQIGNPEVSPYEANVDLFDGADRHFAFSVVGPEGHGQVLSQPEINAMVSSIRPSQASE